MGNGEVTLAQRVRDWAWSRRGQQVGNGECFALADRALRAAGARSAADYGRITANADYQWGEAIALAQVQAGDVLQFRDFSVTITVEVTRVRTQRDGSTQESREESYETYERPHHTAIVSVNPGGGRLLVLEQNAPPRGGTRPERVVRENEIHTAPSTTTQSRVFQEGATTVRETQTTTISVNGSIWAYRPQAR